MNSILLKVLSKWPKMAKTIITKNVIFNSYFSTSFKVFKNGSESFAKTWTTNLIIFNNNFKFNYKKRLI